MIQKVKSRNQREGSFQSRNVYWNRKRKMNRKIKKIAMLSIKGTQRNCTSVRINEVMHRIGIDTAREELKINRKRGTPISFRKGDLLRVVDINDCEEGLRLGDICIAQENEVLKGFIMIKIRRNNKLKQIEKKRFILHKRFIKNE